MMNEMVARDLFYTQESPSYKAIQRAQKRKSLQSGSAFILLGWFMAIEF